MLHIIQNDAHVPPGNLLDALSAPCIIHHPYLGEPLPQLQQISALIVMGGAMGANDDQKHPFLVELKMLIRQIVSAGLPYLGICLGGQLLAAALEAPVVSGRWPESGFLPVQLNAAGQDDALFSGLPKTFTTFQWHHDSFDIPAGGVLLGSSSACPHQAFRAGECAWGLQFHPEVTADSIRDWCAWDPETAQATEKMVADFARHAALYQAFSRQMLANFVQTITRK